MCCGGVVDQIVVVFRVAGVTKTNRAEIMSGRKNRNECANNGEGGRDSAHAVRT